MTLTRKTGQLFLAPFTTKTTLEKAIHLISAYNISGFIFNPTFSANGKRFHSICTNLQQYATEEQPLLLAVDERSNTETIAKNSFTPLPTYKTIGTKNKRVFTKQLAEAIGKELHETGINTTFSSNLFTDNSAMSFSINPRQVAHHAVAMIQGYSKANITTI